MMYDVGWLYLIIKNYSITDIHNTMCMRMMVAPKKFCGIKISYI